MGLRDRVEADDNKNPRRPHVIDRFLNIILNDQQREEALEVLNDRDLSATSIARAIRSEYGVPISDKSIREWRAHHDPAG